MKRKTLKSHSVKAKRTSADATVTTLGNDCIDERAEARSKLTFGQDTHGRFYDDLSVSMDDVVKGFSRTEIDVGDTLERMWQFDNSTDMPSADQIEAKLLEAEAFLNWMTESCKAATDMRAADAPDNTQIARCENGEEYYDNSKYIPGGSTDDVWTLIRTICHRCNYQMPERPPVSAMKTADDELAALDTARNWILAKLNSKPSLLTKSTTPVVEPQSDSAFVAAKTRNAGTLPAQAQAGRQPVNETPGELLDRLTPSQVKLMKFLWSQPHGVDWDSLPDDAFHDEDRRSDAAVKRALERLQKRLNEFYELFQIGIEINAHARRVKLEKSPRTNADK